MADFTGGVIDLAKANIFDNFIIGVGDVVDIIDSNTTSSLNQPIVVKGNMTITGGTINIGNFNKDAGSFTYQSFSVDLSPGGVVPGRSNTYGRMSLGGVGGTYTQGSGVYVGQTAFGGNGGGRTSSLDGQDSNRTGCINSNTAKGYGGSYYGTTRCNTVIGKNGINGSDDQSFGWYGSGGGALGDIGQHKLKACFLVLGNTSITGGTVNGAGGNGGKGGDGGSGVSSGGSDWPAGGGGAGGEGGEGGKIIFLAKGTYSEGFSVKNLSGGLGGAKGITTGSAHLGTDGEAGLVGINGGIEMQDVSSTTDPFIFSLGVSDVWSKTAKISYSSTITLPFETRERALVWATTTSPTEADNKIIISNSNGSSSYTFPNDLPVDSDIYIRIMATIKGTMTNGTQDETVYSNELSFKTHKDFFPKITLIQ